jgi:hypothetical protein
MHYILWGQVGIEPTTSRTQSDNHATRPLTHHYCIITLSHIGAVHSKIIIFIC